MPRRLLMTTKITKRYQKRIFLHSFDAFDVIKMGKSSKKKYEHVIMMSEDLFFDKVKELDPEYSAVSSAAAPGN